MSNKCKPGMARDFVEKMCVNADEVIDIAKVCKALRLSHSGFLRAVVMPVVDDLNHRLRSAGEEWSKVGQLLPMPPCGNRVNFGSAPVHLRL